MIGTLSNDYVSCISEVLYSRYGDIEAYLKKNTERISASYLEDFDWKLKVDINAYSLTSYIVIFLISPVQLFLRCLCGSTPQTKLQLHETKTLTQILNVFNIYN